MLRSILFSLSLSLLTVSFASTPARNGAAKSSTVVTQTREMLGFSGVASDFAGDVFLMQGEAFSVQITGPEHLVGNLHTDVKLGTLQLTTAATATDMERVFVTITMPRIDRIALNGAGDIVVQNSINTKDLTLSIAGRGDLSITNFNTLNLNATITGSGNIRGGIGSTNDATLSITGSGNILMPKVGMSRCEASIAGSGDIKIGSATTIIAYIAGSGDVAHEGESNVSKDIIGKGEVIQL